MNSFKSILSKYGSFPINHYSQLVRWSHWDLLYIHSGALFIKFKNRELEVSRSQAILIPPQTEFRIINKGQITTASVQYFVPYSGSIVSQSLVRLKSPSFYNAKNNQIEPHINELLEIYNPHIRHERLQELLLELVIEKILLFRTGREERTPWRKIIYKYKNRLDNPPSMEEIAEWAGYSPSRFRLIFQNDMGLAPFYFFHKIRLESSSEMLIETVLPIKEVALKHGYREVSHFNRAFSKHFGISPGRFRKINMFLG